MTEAKQSKSRQIDELGVFSAKNSIYFYNFVPSTLVVVSVPIIIMIVVHAKRVV